METNCISCNEQLSPIAVFCHNCGSQQKCKICETNIVKNAKHCIGCGVSLSGTNNISDKAVNTIKFNQTAESRSYEVTFTDNVGAGVVEVIRNMADNQPHLKLYNSKNEIPENIINSKITEQTEDVIAEELDEDKQEQENNDFKFPHLNDVQNNIECSEQHWILIYAFYLSDYGKNTFSKDNLLKTYKDKRGTRSRVSNFSSKWKKLFKGFVKTIKDEEFKLTDKGIETASDLISGKIKSEASKTLQSKKSPQKNKTENNENTVVKKGSKTPAKSIQVEEFDLYKSSEKLSLADFLKERKIDDNTANRILAIAYYITSFCKLSTFSEGNIEYAYKVLGLNKRPLHLHQTILNAKINKLWFNQDDSTGIWKLARPGEVYFEENFKAI